MCSHIYRLMFGLNERIVSQKNVSVRRVIVNGTFVIIIIMLCSLIGAGIDY